MMKIIFFTFIILLASAAGPLKVISGEKQMGAPGVHTKDYEKMKDKLMDELKKRFKPEFLNRIDARVVFHSLTKGDIRQIVDLMLLFHAAHELHSLLRKFRDLLLL